MNRRRFVLTSTVSMLVITLVVAGLAFYTNFTANAFVQGVPGAVRYFPAETQAVFGINVERLISSPVYTQMIQNHEQAIGQDLTDFIAKTGVDPRKDIQYIIGATSAAQPRGGAVIAVGTFNQAGITAFINTKGTPIPVDYYGAQVLMFPEANQLQKGIAFLSPTEIAVGDLDSLHSVLDVSKGRAVGISNNAAMTELLGRVGSSEMFWFAGDATLLSKIPVTNTQYVPNLSAIQNVFGTLSLNSAITGKISITAKDAASAQQLSDFAKGLIALGNLAGAQNPDLAKLVAGIQVAQSAQAATQFDINITIPLDLLTKLESAKAALGAKTDRLKK
jgi:hypothetical protein